MLARFVARRYYLLMSKMMNTGAADKAATAMLADYYERYVGIRGALPGMGVAMMPEYGLGWPVRNPNGGQNIAYFSTADAAQKAVNACDRKYRSGAIKERTRFGAEITLPPEDLPTSYRAANGDPPYTDALEDAASGNTATFLDALRSPKK